MTQLIVETTAEEEYPIRLTADGDQLLYFMSFAAMERTGAEHELAEAAGILKRRFRISLAPLLAFTHAEPENEADRRALERAWQDAEPLADACWLVADALASGNERLIQIVSAYPNLRTQMEELAQIADWAAARQAKVRLIYTL